MIRLRQIKITLNSNVKTELPKKIAKKLHIPLSDIKNIIIHKQSIDARDKKNILICYEVDVEVKNDQILLAKNKSQDIFLTPDEKYIFPFHGKEKLNGPIVVVGSGPAGLFAAYILAIEGYKPIVIERGEKVEKRIKTVETFWQSGRLNPQSNVQFGEGGAGTFSDGKLNTLVHDPFNRGRKVLETFVKFGANEDILYTQKPHVGTDILQKVVVNMRNAIIELGGKFFFESCLTNIEIKNNKIVGIEINQKEKISCNNVILAIGHSARYTFLWLHKLGVLLEAKPFAIGLRVEHPQEMINQSQYGNFSTYLPPASYKLTYKASNNRGVYSFCMCPGGYVVNSSSESNHLCINGMSYRARNSKNANSAIICTVSPKDFGSSPLDGLYFQQELEKRAYELGKGDIPVQLYKDYQKNQISEQFGEFKPEMKGSYHFANLNLLFPAEINEAIKESFSHFEKIIPGFSRDDTILSGVESRTSSPLKILRDEHFEANIKGLYPCGEGAGYAGGIVTSAIDGIKIAEEIIKKYSN